MKILLFTLSLTISTFLAFAQCVPDTSFALLGVGVYPLPDSTCTDAGISCDDCTVSVFTPIEQGIPYAYTMTAVVPDSVTVSTAPIPLTYIDVTGVTGLPAGISYTCNPPDCRFYANTIGCVLISGTTMDPVGSYSISVSASLVNSSGTLPITFPNTIIEALNGCYIFNVREPVSIIENVSSDIIATPNPVNNTANIEFSSNTSGNAILKVYTINGALVLTSVNEIKAGNNSISLDVNKLDNGVYYYNVETNDTKFINKMLVSK